MSKPLRSTTGCTSCKTSSRPKQAYDYVERSGNRGRVKRTRPAPRNKTSLSVKASQSIQDTPSGSPSSSSGLTDSMSMFAAPFDTPSQETYPNSHFTVSCGAVGSLPSVTPNFSVSPWVLGDVGQTTSLSLDLVRLPTSITCTYDTFPNDLYSPPQTLAGSGVEDPEGVELLLCITPILDKNVADNALPFVLHSYSQWAIASVFEPLKIVNIMRERVIAQFTSENTRIRTILIANVMNLFAKQLTIDNARKSILSRLTLQAEESGSAFVVTPPSLVPALDRQNAMRTLEGMLEIFSLQTTTQCIATCIQSLDHAAPVFRRACSEPPGQPINLPNILLSHDLNLRHFATVDIIKSVTTGLPTYFRYEVPFSLELCERMCQMQHSHGLQWLHGYPDQFILLLAWINSLCDAPQAIDHSELVAWIEINLPRIRVAIDDSGDPTLRIGRMVVQECWRFAVLIYLYMALCKADAYDHRVIRAHKGFMRLVKGVKPARQPDAYLFRPIVIMGVATIDEHDRDIIRQRILNVRECAELGTVGNDILLELEDIWARTKYERRAAVWGDLRIANSRLTGR